MVKIQITAGGIYGADGELPIGTELELESEPTAWAGRYTVLSEGKGGKAFVTGGPVAVDTPSLEARTVADLKALADEHGVDLQGATKKDDIIAAIQLAAEPKA